MADPVDPIDAAWDAAPEPSAEPDAIDAAWEAAPAPAAKPTYDVTATEPLQLGEQGQLQPIMVHLGKPGEVTTQEPTHYQLDEEQLHRADRISTLFRQAHVGDADTDAAMLRFAKDANLRFATVKDNYPALEMSWKAARFDPVKWMTDNPALSKMLLDNPELHNIVLRDKQLSTLSKAWNWLEEADSHIQRKLGIEVSWHPPKSDAELQAAQNPGQEAFVKDETSDKLAKGWTVYSGLPFPVPNRALVPAKRFGEMWDQMQLSFGRYELMRRRDAGQDTYALETKLADMELGAVRRDYNEGPVEQILTDVAEAAASSLAPLPEAGALAGSAAAGAGAVTLLATKSPAAAGAAALEAGSMFGQAGAVYGTFKLESGSAYGDMLAHGLDERTASTAAKVYGTLAAGIEFASWGPMFKAMGPVGAMLKEGSTEAFTKALLESGGFRAALKRWAVLGPAEGGEEFLQDATQQAVEYFARSKQAGRFLSDDASGVHIGQALDAGWKGSIGGWGMGLIHSGLHMTTRSLLRDRALESQKAIGLLNGLGDSPTVHANPEAAAEMVAHLAPELGKGLYVEAPEFNRLYQSQAEELLGPGGEARLKEALATGGKVEVPLPVYLDKWAGKDPGRALADRTATAHDLPTPRQVDEKALKETAEALAKAWEKGEAPEAETPGEASFLAAAEKQLATVTGDATEARQKMGLMRATLRTWAERFQQDPNKLFHDVAVIVEAGLNPTAREVLSERSRSTETQRAEELYRDEATGLPNRLAFDEATRPAGKQVAHVAVEGIKWLNDGASHDKADLLARAVGLALEQQGLKPHKVGGGDFAFYVGDEAELRAGLEKVRAAMPEQLRGFALTGAIGPDLASAEYMQSAALKAAVASGARANPRPVLRDELGLAKLDAEGEEQVLDSERPKGLAAGVEAKTLDLPIAKATPELAAELKDRASKLTPEDFFNKAYVDQRTGEWTALGWSKLPRRKHVVSLDLANLRLVNDRFDKETGNRMIESMGLAAQTYGGEAFDFTHHHGDEYSAQSDDPKALEQFVEHLRAVLTAKPLAFREPETGELTPVPVQFHHGFGDDLKRADEDLGVRKRRFKEAKKAGLARRGSGPVGPQRHNRAAQGGVAVDAARAHQGAGPDASPSEVAKADDYSRARALIARATVNKAAYQEWFTWCVDKKGKGERPKVAWAIESTMARYGVVDPINDFSGDERGRDMAGRGTGARKKTQDQPDALRESKQNRGGAWWQRFKQDESTLFYQFPTPARLWQMPRLAQQPSGTQLRAGPKGYTDVMQEGMNRLFKVVLNPTADHSTFLHESAHIFLELMSNLAARPDAPKRLQEDYSTALKWLGAASPDDLVVKSKADDDPARMRHEKWARAFERYLLEGKAPARHLVRLFERFRLWLGKVYRDQRMLGVELSDDIRGVFDRMLATDTEIERYRARMGLDVTPLARDVFGVTPEQYDEFLEKRVQLTATATARVDFAIAKDRLREQEAWWKDELRKEKAEAADIYEYLPARRAQQTLAGKGELWGRSTPAIVLDRATVVAAVGEKDAKKFRTTSKEGVDPGEVADFLGYPTGEAMLKDVLALPLKDPWVKETAETAMREKHGDVVSSLNTLREHVGKGLHGDATLAYLIAEWQALRLKVDKSPGAHLWTPQVTSIEGTHAAAKIIVGRRAIGRLEVGQTLANERKAADACALACARGNFRLGFTQKATQLLNMFVWREMSQARDEREAFLDLANKLNGAKAQGRLGKASPVYRDGAANLLEALGLGGPSEAPGVSIDDIIKQMEEDGQVIAIDQQALEQVFVKERGWKDLTVTEMRLVRDTLSSIEAAARGKNEVLYGEKRLDRAEVTQQILDYGNRLPPIDPASTEGAAFLPELVVNAWHMADGSMMKPEVMLEWFGSDIHSPVFRALVLPLQLAKHKEVDLLRGPIKRIVDAFDKMPSSIVRRASQRIDGKALFPGHTDKVKPPQRRWELLIMLLNSGNSSNLDRLTKGRDITEQQVRDAAVKVGITKDEYDWVQAVWDAAEDLKKPAFDLEERDTGIRPEAIEARAFKTPFGEYRGGYFPAVYSRAGKTDVGERQHMAQFQDQTYTAPGTARSHLKARAEEFSDIIDLSPKAIYRHLSQVAHDIAFREPVRSVGQLLLDDRVKAMLIKRLGEPRARHFIQWARDIGQMKGIEGATHVPLFLTAMQGLRGALSMAALGGSVQNALEDAWTGIAGSVFASELKSQHLAAGIAAIRSGLGTAALDAAEAQSGELRARRGQMSRELLSTISQLIARSPLAKGHLRFIKDHAFYLQETVDRRVSAALWIGANRQALANGMNAADATVWADRLIRQVLPSHHVVDSAALLRNKGFIGASLVFFRFWSTAYNIDRRHGPSAFTGLSSARAAGAAMGFLFTYAILGSLVRGQGPDPGEPWNQWFYRKLATGAASRLPWIGDLAEGFASDLQGKRRDPRNNSITGMLTSIYQLAVKAGDGDKEADVRLRAALRALALATGQPLGQPLRTGGYLFDLATGNIDARGPGDVAGGLIYGQGQNQPANPGTLLQDMIEGVPLGTGPAQ